MYAAWLFFGDRFKDVYFPDAENWTSQTTIAQDESGWPSDCVFQVRALGGSIFLLPPPGFRWAGGSSGNERPIALEESYTLHTPYNGSISIIPTKLDRKSLSFVKYAFHGGSVTIGRSEQCVVTDIDQNISGMHGYITANGASCEYTDKSVNGTYLNGRRIMNNTVRITFGDVLTFPSGLKMIYLGNILAFNQIASLQKVKLQKAQPEAIRPMQNPPEHLPSLYREYHRAPRILQKPHSESIEIEPPIAKQAKETAPMWQQLGPSATMMLPMMAGTMVGVAAGRSAAMMASGLVMVGTSSALAVMWGVINRRYRARQEAENETRRIQMYQQYIEETEQQLRGLNNQEYDRLVNTYPNIGECVTLPTDNTYRLWNRMPTHSDFLHVRLGIGQVNLPSEIEVPKQKLSIIDDPLRNEPERLKNVYSIIADAPYTVGLRSESVVGILGGDEATLFAQGLLMQIASLHSYHDVRIAVLTRETTVSQWSWARWLPHVFASEDREMRMVVSRPSAIHDVMSHVSDVLTMRRSSMEEHSSSQDEEQGEDARPLPHYIIFCTDNRLLENEPILKQLLTNRLGMTLIMLAPSMEMLPKECRLIFNVAAKPGYLHTSEGETTQIDFEVPNRNLLQTFASQIAPLRVRDAAENAAIPSLVSFLDIYGVRRTEDLDVWRMWTENHTYDGLRSTIGYAAGSQPFILDISDKYHGPHGLIAGTTGSGKSVMLQTYILSLALNYSPDQVQFILIDYKGGGMADAFRTLPHVAGIIDNLQGELVINRALASLNGEIHRRERIFKAHDVSSINDYTQLFGSDPAEPKLPHLIIIVDEFAELKSDQPDFMRELVSASRVGRSLGVHLILATQKPSNSVSDEIWANSRFHLCLRVQTRSDSMEMLKRPDAAYIKGMGRCFIQIGNDELFEQVQTSYSGLAYNPNEPRAEEMPHLLGDTGEAIRVAKKRKSVEEKRKEKTQMDAVLERIREVAGEHDLLHTKQMWLPQLTSQLYFGHMPMAQALFRRGNDYANAPEGVQFLLGMADDVAQQRYIPFTVNLTQMRNLMIVGLAGTGKTTAVQSIVTAIASQYDAEHVQMYILSLTSQTLGNLIAFPQVGDIAFEQDVIEIKRFINMLFEEEQRRSDMFAQVSTDSFIEYNRACRLENKKGVPAIVVFVDRYEQLKNMFANDDFYTARIQQLLREGSGRGIHFIVTALAKNEIPGRLHSFFSGIALQLRERADYTDVLGKRVPYDMPPLMATPGRALGLVGEDNVPYELQIALGGVSIDAPDAPFADLNDIEPYCLNAAFPPFEGLTDVERSARIIAEAKAMDEAWKGARPARIPRIPEEPTLEQFREVDGFTDAQRSPYQLPIGYDMTKGSLATLDLEKNYSMYVTGPKKSGLTNFLKLTARLFAERGADIHIIGDANWKTLADELGAHLYATEDEIAIFMDMFVREYPGKRRAKREAALAQGKAAARKQALEFKPCVILIDNAERLPRDFNAPRFVKSPVMLAKESEAAAAAAQEAGETVPEVKTAAELAPGQDPNRNVPAKNYICDVFGQMAGKGDLYNLFLFIAMSSAERMQERSEPLKSLIAQQRGIALGGKFNENDPLGIGAGLPLQSRSKALPSGYGYMLADGKVTQIRVPLTDAEEE